MQTTLHVHRALKRMSVIFSPWYVIFTRTRSGRPVTASLPPKTTGVWKPLWVTMAALPPEKPGKGLSLASSNSTFSVAFSPRLSTFT